MTCDTDAWGFQACAMASRPPRAPRPSVSAIGRAAYPLDAVCTVAGLMACDRRLRAAKGYPRVSPGAQNHPMGLGGPIPEASLVARPMASATVPAHPGVGLWRCKGAWGADPRRGAFPTIS